MGKTPVFNLRWPELGDPSDAPDGYEDLAEDTETALLGLRDTPDDLAYTPTWRSAGSVQPSGASWNGRYSIRGGRCFLTLFGQFSTSTTGGTGAMAVGLPVRSRANFTEQEIFCKLFQNGYSWCGFAYVPINSLEMLPYFPASQTRGDMWSWTSADESRQPGTGIPAVPGRYGVENYGNFAASGTYLV